MNAVMWSFGQIESGRCFRPGRNGASGSPLKQASPANGAERHRNAHYADLLAIQVGDEQQTDIENPNGLTKAWFDAAQRRQLYTDKLLYVNSTFINSDAAYFDFIANANPDAISWDAYPFGTTGVYPYNWLGKAQHFRRAALGQLHQRQRHRAAAIRTVSADVPSASDGARDPGDLEMRWQQFTAWTLGYTFVDAFTVGGGNKPVQRREHGQSPNQPRYNQFKESCPPEHEPRPGADEADQLRLWAQNIVSAAKTPAVYSTPLPIDWPDLQPTNAPPNQQYLTGVSAQNLGTKNNGQPGRRLRRVFQPAADVVRRPGGYGVFHGHQRAGRLSARPNAAGERLHAADHARFQFRLQRNQFAPTTQPQHRAGRSRSAHASDRQPVSLIFNLEGGTGDLFKYNDGSPFVGIELPIDQLYWDNDGTAAGNNTANGAGLGGSGTWDTAASKWFNGSTNGTWVANKAAIFWGTAGTVTLAAAQSANRLQFKSNGYTVTGSTLTMSGSEIGVDSGMTATINSTVAGSFGINKTGSGTLVLGNASNSYTGGTTIGAGALRVSNDGSLGAVPGSLDNQHHAQWRHACSLAQLRPLQ